MNSTAHMEQARSAMGKISGDDIDSRPLALLNEAVWSLMQAVDGAHSALISLDDAIDLMSSALEDENYEARREIIARLTGMTTDEAGLRIHEFLNEDAGQ